MPWFRTQKISLESTFLLCCFSISSIVVLCRPAGLAALLAPRVIMPRPAEGRLHFPGTVRKILELSLLVLTGPFSVCCPLQKSPVQPGDGMCCLAKPITCFALGFQRSSWFYLQQTGWECERDGCPGRKWVWMPYEYFKDHGPCHCSYCFPLQDPISPSHINKHHFSCCLGIFSFIQCNFTLNAGVSPPIAPRN